MPAAFASLATSRRLACACSSSSSRASRSSQQQQQAPTQRSAAAARRLTTAICAAGGNQNQQVASIGNASAPVTDDAVPEAHKGLHASLYGEGDAADAHGSAATTNGGGGGDGPYRARPVRMFFSFSLLFFLFRPFSLPLDLSTPRLTPNPHSLEIKKRTTLQEDDGSAVVALESWLSDREGGKAASSAADDGEAEAAAPPPPVPGVYAIFDSGSKLQHVGYARDAVRAVRAAREAVGEQRAHSIRAKLFAPGRGKMVGRAELSGLAAAWLADEAASSSSSSPPPGNTSAEAALWAGGGGGVAAASSSSSEASSSSLSSISSSDAEEGSVVVAPATASRGMTPAQAALHADRKEKLEKAMGVKKKEEELKAEAAREAALSPEERRLKLKNAVEGGDWSAVIDGQTRETLQAVAPGRTEDSAAAAVTAAAAAAPAQNRPVTPFARASVHRAVGEEGSKQQQTSSSSSSAPASSEEGEEEKFILTVETAEAALDEVRPYLIADGGNVEVVEVVAEDGDGPKSYVVRVMLQGACGTCGSASATMAMGIERALRATFGAAVSRVERVSGLYGMTTEAEADEKATALAVPVSVDAIDGLLDGLRPAIAAYEGSVEVVSVSPETNVATLKYSGPDSIGVGIVMAVKDRFPALSEVKLISG